MSHLRIWRSRIGDLYFSGKIDAVEADVDWLEFRPAFKFGQSRSAEAVSQAEGLKQAFQVVAVREEAQKHDRSNSRDRR